MFNSETGDPPCEASVSPLVEADIPFLLSRGRSAISCSASRGTPNELPGGNNPDLPPVGTLGESVSITAEFDGWGYSHLLDRESLEEVGYYAPGQVFDPDYAAEFGDLTMRTVEGDPDDPNGAFISWYSLGMRAIEANTGNDVAARRRLGCGDTTDRRLLRRQRHGHRARRDDLDAPRRVAGCRRRRLHRHASRAAALMTMPVTTPQPVRASVPCQHRSWEATRGSPPASAPCTPPGAVRSGQPGRRRSGCCRA